MNNNVILSGEISTLVERIIKETLLGSLAFIVQDSRVVQLERHEKYQFPNRPQNHKTKAGFELVETRQPLERIRKALSGIQFGQVLVKFQEGRIVQIDRTEKQRVPELSGLEGDGI